MAKPQDGLPYWATLDVNDPITGLPNKVNPVLAKKNAGHVYKEFPPANWMNWWQNNVREWVQNYDESFEDFEGDTTDATETEIFVDGVTNSRLVIADGSVVFDALVSAVLDDADESKSWKIKGQINNNGSYLFLSQLKEIIGSLNWVDISTAVYNSKFKLVSGEDTTPTGLFFKPDGTKMYITGSTNDTIFEYDLSTAWDVSTAVYNSKFFDISGEDLIPKGLFFKPDGAKMYIIGATNFMVFEYDLSTAWDVSTAVYNSKFKLVSSEDGLPLGLFFKPDGTKMYITGDANDTAFEYDLSTPWDVSSAVYNSKFKLVSGEDAVPNDIFFKPDGTKMYIVGDSSDKIFEYDLSTPWDVSSAVYNSKFKLVSSEDTIPIGLFFKPDGTKIYITGNSNDTVFEYDLSTPWDVNFDFDANNEALTIKVIGETSKNITWKVRLDKLINSI